MTTNRDRQADEIEAISSICDSNEFFKLPGQDYELGLDVPPIIENGILDIKYSNVILMHSLSQTYRHFSVKNLPPSCLRLHLPRNYPEYEPPQYQLEISWLPPWESSRICHRLDELWDENEGSEIIFLWRDFLQNEIFDYLNYKGTLDVSFLFALHHEPDDLVNITLLKLADPRVTNGALFLHPMRYLSQYDGSRRKCIFIRSLHICEICFEEFSGRLSMEFDDCGHVYCKNCMTEYFSCKIKEGKVEKILCPNFGCYCQAQSNQIKAIVPSLYPKYEELVLLRSLGTMNDVVFCPRITCQAPVITEPDENLATCSNCEYNFCIYCRKVYHGVAPCDMTSKETLKLIEAYLKANWTQKQKLLKKYGRHQIQSVVEASLTREYIKTNTKPCPQCQTPTEKVDGCNKIICSHCKSNFCWLCGLRITSNNAYDHFLVNNQKNPCYRRLFEGIEGAEDDDVPY